MTLFSITAAVKDRRESNKQKKMRKSSCKKLFKGPPLYCQKGRHGEVLFSSRVL